MLNWKSIPEGGWSSFGSMLTAVGAGRGPFGMSYCLAEGQILNGRISATVFLSAHRAPTGLGLICRANELSSFVGFFAVAEGPAAMDYSLRLGAFHYGATQSLIALKDPVPVVPGSCRFTLQFFADEIRGEIQFGEQTYGISERIPDIPFPGQCGIISLYRTPVAARAIQIEELSMAPRLPPMAEVSSSQYKYDVFLSHAAADKVIVMRVAEALGRAGVSYWVDHEQIKFGDPIVSKIENGLLDSRTVIVCVSKNLGSSNWCRAEYGPILYREFSGNSRRRVVPLRIDGSADIDVPLLLSDKLRADFTDPEVFGRFVEFLRA